MGLASEHGYFGNGDLRCSLPHLQPQVLIVWDFGALVLPRKALFSFGVYLVAISCVPTGRREVTQAARPEVSLTGSPASTPSTITRTVPVGMPSFRGVRLFNGTQVRPGRRVNEC